MDEIAAAFPCELARKTALEVIDKSGLTAAQAIQVVDGFEGHCGRCSGDPRAFMFVSEPADAMMPPEPPRCRCGRAGCPFC